MTDSTNMDAHEASAAAAHKAKSAQAAVELAREVQNEELVVRTAQKTKEALLQGLKEVFGDDGDDPKQMRILVRRIPIVCTNIQNMHDDITDMKDNLKWGIRIILGCVILGVMKLILIP